VNLKLALGGRVQKWLRIGHQVFLYVVVGYAGILVAIPLASIDAQPRTDIGRRIDNIEGIDQKILDGLQSMDHRITVLETILSDQKDEGRWSQLSLGGIGLLLAKSAIEVLAKRKKTEGSE